MMLSVPDLLLNWHNDEVKQFQKIILIGIF